MSDDLSRVFRSIGPVKELIQGLRDYGYEQIGYLQINEKCLDAADLIEAQATEITRLRAALATARREGMDEAARIADAFEVVTHLHGPWSDVGHECAAQAAREIAAAIRAAKEGE